MAGRFSIEAIFKAIDKVTAPVSKMQNRVSRFVRSYEKGLTKLNRTTDKLAAGLKRVGVVAAASMFAASVAIADVVNTGADFEQTLVNAAAKYPNAIRQGTEAFEKLEKVARDVGGTTEFSTRQAAQGLNFLAMAGFNAEQSMAALPRIVDLATAAQVDLATASDMATDTLGAFNLSTKDAIQLGKNLNRVNDVMARTVTTANTDMEQMFETIQTAGPVATSAGASIETFSALLGELANAGIKGSEAGTTLKNMFLRLAAPPAEAAKALQFLTVKTKDARGNMRDMFDILEDIGTAIGKKGLGSADKSAVLNEIFSLRAVAGANVLLAAGTNKLRKYREMLRGASGAASQMASIMRDTVKGRMLDFESAVESVKISLFLLRKDGISKIIESATSYVRKFDELINTNEELANQIINDVIAKVILATKVFAGFVAVVVVLKTVVLVGNSALIIYKGSILAAAAATKIWALATVGVTKVLAFAKAGAVAFSAALSANPIGLIVIAIAALIAIIVLLIKNWDTLKEKFLGLPKPVQAALTIAFLPLVLVFGLVRKLIGVFQEAGPIIGAIMDFIGEKIAARIAFVKAVFVAFFSLFGVVGEKILSIFSRIGEFISSIFDKVSSSPIISKVIDKLANMGAKFLFGVDSEGQKEGAPVDPAAPVINAVEKVTNTTRTVERVVDKVDTPVFDASMIPPVVSESPVTNIQNMIDKSVVSEGAPEKIINEGTVTNVFNNGSMPDMSRVPGAGGLIENKEIDNSTKVIKNLMTNETNNVENVVNTSPTSSIEKTVQALQDPVVKFENPVKEIMPENIVNQGDVTNIFNTENSPTETVTNFGSANDDSADDKVAVMPRPQMVTPQERVARTIEEHRETSSAELTIRDETGRGELKQDRKNKNVNIALQRTGSF